MKKSCLLSGMMMLGVIANVNAMMPNRPVIAPELDALAQKRNWHAIFVKLNQMQGDIVNKYITIDGGTLLIDAVIDGNSAAAKILLEKYNANPDIAIVAEHPSSGGATPLMLACMRGNTAMVKLLLDHKANPYLKDKWGKTVYAYAKDPEILDLLRTYANPSSAAAA